MKIKTSLAHLPEQKIHELHRAVATIVMGLEFNNIFDVVTESGS
ncbi:hypothetical protein [Shewanella sp. YLB-07]|nr:hypothetical protein [Shewanella sp. YLB-07]